MRRIVFTVDDIQYDSAVYGSCRQDMITLKNDGDAEDIHWETRHDVWYWRSGMAVDEQLWIDSGYIRREGDWRTDATGVRTEICTIQEDIPGVFEEPWS